MAKSKYITIQEDQSVWDLALQEYGSTEGVLQLMKDNVGLIDFENNTVPGTKLLIDESKIINKDVVLLLKQKAIKPANGIDRAGNLVAFSSGFGKAFK